MADPTVDEGEFVYVGELKVTEEDLLREIQQYKEKHSGLLEDISKLEHKKWEADSLAQKVKNKVWELDSILLESEKQLLKKEQQFLENMKTISEDNKRLNDQAEDIKEKIIYFEQETRKLDDICNTGVERKMVFKGKINNSISKSGLTVKHRIRYPLNSGSALVTFEEPSVAAAVIVQKHHQVKIAECCIDVKAELVELLVLDSLSMDMNVSPLKILVSNLPSSLSEEAMLDKLELFFQKSKNGGGDVESVDFLPESRTVIITFLNEGVAPRLTEKKYFDVPFGKTTHKIQVSPSLNGNLKNHQMKNLVCNRTVLLTGIPDIIDSENLRDLLEIHFQRVGDVQVLLYCAKEQHVVALFEDDIDDLTLGE